MYSTAGQDLVLQDQLKGNFDRIKEAKEMQQRTCWTKADHNISNKHGGDGGGRKTGHIIHYKASKMEVNIAFINNKLFD